MAGRLLFTYKNINDAVTEGVELDGEVAVTSQISVAGAYTYLDARDDITDLPPDRPQRAPGQRPRHVARTRSASSPTCAACSTATGSPLAPPSTASRWTRSRPGYSLWDVYASQRVVRGLNVFVAIDNLADKQDPNLGKLSANGAPLAIYRPEAGRTARFGVRWSWSK